MKGRHYLGIDIGSSSLKGVLADSQGRICSYRRFPNRIVMPQPGWAESDPGHWWEGVRTFLEHTFDECPEARTSLRGIFVSGMVPNLVPLDRDGQPVRPAILYRDNRAIRECRRIRTEHGQACSMQDVLPKWIWLREYEPESYHRIRTIVNSHSYIVYCLTGVLSMDSDIAALIGDGVYQPEKRWNRQLLEKMGLDPGALPPIWYPTETVGYVREELAREFGLEVPVPVFAGDGDSLSSMTGSGVVNRGDAMIYLGTAATLWFLEADLAELFRKDIFGSGKIHFLANILSGGELLSWFRDALQLENELYPLDRLDTGAREIAPGSHGLMVLPHFMGKRFPNPRPDAWGSILGLNPAHTGVHVYRALMEGVAYHLRSSYEASSRRASRFVVAGGGATSDLWRQILSDVFARDIEYHPGKEMPLGNAYLAGIARGDFPDFSQLRTWLPPAEVHHPDPERVQVYKACYNAYTRMDEILNGIYATGRTKTEEDWE